MANTILPRYTNLDCNILRSRLFALVIVLMICFAETCVANTDIVTFANGNIMIGEIKKLERGKLTFETDSTDTIRIEWDDVTSLVSNQNLQFEVTSGQRYLGHLVDSPETGKLGFKTEEEIIIMPIVSVVSIFPIENVLRERFDGSVRAGYTFSKASDVTHFNLGIDAEYRTEKRIFSVSLDSNITHVAGKTIQSENSNITLIDGETTQNQDFEFYFQGLRANRWFTGAVFKIEKKDELGIDLRNSIGGGIGRYLIQTTNNNLAILGGLMVSSEHINETGDRDTLTEGMFALSYDWFRYDEPELDVEFSLQIYPSISDFGRVRGELDLVFRWELVHDLFWEVDFYDDYDSGPPGGESSSSDYGVITSVGYKF